jgi:hypothetical protein
MFFLKEQSLMEYNLPPVSDINKLHAELALVSRKDREDAMQESWVAHLSGEDAIQAVKTYAVREMRYRKRNRNHGMVHDIQP